ncbi:MurR/RpiR family transcriptional regulator [Motiliproteus sediminis]|uniref:MurR/RpiR family transcriptional regulator n=1 Tax=Motiliproteus sediminis TaxID=1468178 RepID=UPI001AEF7F17|nr:MurR/RpiR family transcriptional regulator [Motiliproteus sediminis]
MSRPTAPIIPDDAQSALQALGAVYPQLTQQLQLAADYVLDNPVEVALLSIRKTAEAAGVTTSTLTRLAKTLGFDRYDQFRQMFQQAVQERAPSTFGDRAQNLQEQARAHPDSQQFFNFASAAYQDLGQLFQEETLVLLQDAAARLTKARRVYALGFRDAYALAHHFAYVGRIAFPRFSLIRGGEGMLLSELAAIGAGDVVVVFGSDPYTAETVKAVEIIRGTGAELIAVTDSLRSPLAQGAAVAFTLANDTPHFFPSILTAVALVEALLGECVAAGGKPMLRHIAAYEERLNQLGGYTR